jgi:DNA-binding cell septation regulator SpoVG
MGRTGRDGQVHAIIRLDLDRTLTMRKISVSSGESVITVHMSEKPCILISCFLTESSSVI